MASEDHKNLAAIIKETHALLRKECQNYGPEIAWQRHIARKDTLQKYADSMHKLATTYWNDNSQDEKNQKCISRVEWIRERSKEYFFDGGEKKYDDRELNILMKMSVNNARVEHVNSDMNQQNCSNNVNAAPLNKRITLLDVGSCYNPFGTYDMFDTTAIDIAPVPGKSLKCDFLKVGVGEQKILSQDSIEVLRLPHNAYQTVVFSLFLEYLPCPEMRYLCCQKAYDLLRIGGILFIITPDSKHVGANAKLIKSWRYILSRTGFMRVKYEKFAHIHCLMFRKCKYKKVAERWADMQKITDNDPLYKSGKKLFIPQDFQASQADCTTLQGKDNESEENSTCAFVELPFNIS